jgi:hypothetical protein
VEHGMEDRIRLILKLEVKISTMIKIEDVIKKFVVPEVPI